MVHVTEKIFDHIVVGSGPSGAMCAQTLVAAGQSVLLIDGADMHNGKEDLSFRVKNFDEIRRNVADQHSLFIGKDFEGIDWSPVQGGGQLTPARKYIRQQVKEWMPVALTGFDAIESLAYGGLGNVWGLGCYMFSPSELELAQLPCSMMREAYQAVADRIGISYSRDDIEPYTMPGLQGLLPAIKIDDNAHALLRHYQQRRERIHQKDFFMGIPALALLTEDKDHRQANDYSNMDFYGNEGLSAYRPSITIDELKQNPLFAYIPGAFVTMFREEEEHIKVQAIITATHDQLTFTAKKLLLSCGTLGTARIVLRSSGSYNTRLPLLCNPYSYLTCLQWERLGKVPGIQRTSMAQLSLFHDPGGHNTDVAMASLYSYSSLLIYRVIKEVSLNFRDALSMMQYILPATIIAGIHHPDAPGTDKYVQLVPDSNSPTGDHLAIGYQLNEEERQKIEQREKLFAKIFRQLRCLPVKKVRPPFGTSAHYAGVLPFSQHERPFTTQPDGRLSTTRNVFIADGSGFTYLPAKGLTFTLMANAHRVALNALQHK